MYMYTNHKYTNMVNDRTGQNCCIPAILLKFACMAFISLWHATKHDQYTLISSQLRLYCPLWCRLTQVVLEKRPLNGCCSCSSSVAYLRQSLSSAAEATAASRSLMWSPILSRHRRVCSRWSSWLSPPSSGLPSCFRAFFTGRIFSLHWHTATHKHVRSK